MRKLKVKKIDEMVKDISKEMEESSEKLEVIEEEVKDAGKDVDEIKEDVEELKEDIDNIQKGQRSILNRLRGRIVPDKFAFDDLAQQIVGALILSSPLAVTQEVWILAGALDIYRVVVILAITLIFNILLIYFTKYQAVEEQKILHFIPTRLLSQLIVSYTTAALMLYIFGVIGGQVTSTFWTIKLIIFVGLFANIGAGTADLLK